MEKGEDVLKPHLPVRKKRKMLKEKQIDDKVRERPSMAGSSNSERPEQKQTVLGFGGIGSTSIDLSNSTNTLTCGNVHINYNSGDRRRNDLDVSKDTRGDIFPTSKFGETAARRNMEKIWGLIIGDVKKIGVYGMGGIGKTTVMKYIYNRILEEKKNKFDYVIWVTVSKKSSIFNLQCDIAKEIGVDLSKYKDQARRSRELCKALKQKGRYLLILDDLWEGYPLEDVGIPDPDDPTSSNICKLVLTTRLLEVCRSMKFEDIKMDLLSKNEAWGLFLHYVGHDVKDFEPIARAVALKCAGLPLAIAIIGRSMAVNKEACEWRVALTKLRDISKEPGDEIKKVIEQLKFSFDRLADKKFQKCMKCCALYPEDYEIGREELVELLILEGIIEEKKSRRDEIDECNAILNKLINQCLLEGGENWNKGSFVKMHDLVRDMTLQIDDLHSQYLTISGTKMKKLNHVIWSGDLLKIHISFCDSLNASPMCPRLTTFILHNSSLRDIPDSFFQHLEALKVLKLSHCNYLEVLPNSISNLVNLVGLFIGHCKKLTYVPTLAILKNLQSLEISFISSKDVLNGLEELRNLRYLNVLGCKIKMLPPKIIPKLSNLQYLACDLFYELSRSELMSLENLEILHGRIGDIYNLCDFVKHREQKRSPVKNYKILVSSVFDHNPFGDETNLRGRRKCFDKVIKLYCYTLDMPSGENDRYLLPKDVQKLIMKNIYDLTSLCTITSLNYATDLRECCIISCSKVRELVTASSSSSFALQSLETLTLYDLENLEALIGGKKASCNVFPCLQELKIRCPRIKVLFYVGLLSNLQNLEILTVLGCGELEEIIGGESLDNDEDVNEATTCDAALPKLRGKKAPCNVFPCLKELEISHCERIKVLFNVGLLSNLQNLEILIVWNCRELEEIIGGESLDNDKDVNEATTCDVALPKLRSLRLIVLPNLKSICPPTRRLICESLKKIDIEECPELKQCVYAALELEDSGEPSPSPSLQPIQLNSK